MNNGTDMYYNRMAQQIIDNGGVLYALFENGKRMSQWYTKKGPALLDWERRGRRGKVLTWHEANMSDRG